MRKALRIIIGIVLIAGGILNIYKAFNNPKKEDVQVLEQSSDIFIGDKTTDADGVTFCVNSVENVKSVGEGSLKVSTDNNFVVLNISITNTGDEPYEIVPTRFLLLLDGKEHTFAENTVLCYDNYLCLDKLNPDLTNEYVVVYETQKSTDETEYKLKIKPNTYSKYNNRYITLKNRDKNK